MVWLIHNDRGPVFIKVSSLSFDEQPLVAFTSKELALEFCRFWTMEKGISIRAHNDGYGYRAGGQMVLFESRDQLAAYKDAPASFALEPLVHSFPGEA